MGDKPRTVGPGGAREGEGARASTRRAGRSRVITREELKAALDSADLTAEEEKVLRMRYGLAADADMELGTRAGDEATQAQLLDLEAQLLRALRDSGQITRKDLMIAQLKTRK